MRHQHLKAFSLIELLVVIAVVGLLLAITLPALAAVRVRSRELKSGVNARSLTLLKLDVAAQQGGRFRYDFDHNAVPECHLTPGSGRDHMIAPHNVYQWHRSTGLCASTPLTEAFISPFVRHAHAGTFTTSIEGGWGHYFTAHYIAGNTLAHDPKGWMPEFTPDPTSRHLLFWTMNFVSSIRYPSQKVILHDVIPLRGPISTLDQLYAIRFAVAMADGSASIRTLGEATPPVNSWVAGDLEIRPIHNTHSGILGIDYATPAR